MIRPIDVSRTTMRWLIALHWLGCWFTLIPAALSRDRSLPEPHVMTGLEPVICSSTVRREMAGSRPAMTSRDQGPLVSDGISLTVLHATARPTANRSGSRIRPALYG